MYIFLWPCLGNWLLWWYFPGHWTYSSTELNWHDWGQILHKIDFYTSIYAFLCFRQTLWELCLTQMRCSQSLDHNCLALNNFLYEFGNPVLQCLTLKVFWCLTITFNFPVTRSPWLLSYTILNNLVIEVTSLNTLRQSLNVLSFFFICWWPFCQASSPKA